MAQLTQCPQNSLQGFPVKLDITPSEAIYDQVEEAITADFQFATRTTIPSFLDTSAGNGLLDEGEDSSSTKSTLRFERSTATLLSAQLCKATHNTWLSSTQDQASNTEDFVCIFENDKANPSLYDYIAIVIPLARKQETVQDDPAYLKSLVASGQNPGVSLVNFFPTDVNTRFALYSVCLRPATAGSSVKNMYVFVSTVARTVSAKLMQDVLAAASFRTPREFPQFYFPDVTVSTVSSLTVGTAGTAGGVGSNFVDHVRTTTNLLNAEGARKTFAGGDIFEREDPTSAYKCVPLDPDLNVIDGKLTVDTKKGTLLSNVLKERDTMRGEIAVAAPGRIEKYLGTALGIILTIILFGGIIYILLSYFLLAPTTVSGPTGSTVVQPPDWKKLFTGLPLYIILGSLGIFVGFVIGLSLA